MDGVNPDQPGDDAGYGLEPDPAVPPASSPSTPSTPSPPRGRPRITAGGRLVDPERIQRRLAEGPAAPMACGCGYSRVSLAPTQRCPECGRPGPAFESPIADAGLAVPVLASILGSPVTGPIAAILVATSNERRREGRIAEALALRRRARWMVLLSFAQPPLIILWLLL